MWVIEKCDENEDNIAEYLNYVIKAVTPIIKKFVSSEIIWQFTVDNSLVFDTNFEIADLDRHKISCTLFDEGFNTWIFTSLHIIPVNNVYCYCLSDIELTNSVKEYIRKKYLKELI